ncbi:hypothetical protein [Nesterenkonia halotolerans]|uniref:Uncharacterized protein n=1 Tax=Nesterenkonia halotolerans TaxID=225325 RepID=A0ABR9J5L9_9MICC|nr:hypothetical protein [Nesterenkonia halotolerans]MBE1514290.1 hypothetical protein [Nesterenkonia halotolerans]
MVDFWGEGVPNWLMSVSTLLTLVVAGVAAFFAYKAAHWTKDQAEASRDQAKYALEALEVAQRDSELANATSERQRAEADRSYRLLVEAQLDSLAPVVLATARPSNFGPNGAYLWSHRYVGGIWESNWNPITDDLEVGGNEQLQFRYSAALRFRNVSDTVAHIEILGNSGGKFPDYPDFTLPSVVVPPHEERFVNWSRYWLSDALRSAEIPQDPWRDHLKMQFRVRDQGMNVRDTYEFLADLRFFSQDGSRLIVKPKQDRPWDESVATSIPGRVYERLDQQGTQMAPEPGV